MNTVEIEAYLISSIRKEIAKSSPSAATKTIKLNGKPYIGLINKYGIFVADEMFSIFTEWKLERSFVKKLTPTYKEDVEGLKTMAITINLEDTQSIKFFFDLDLPRLHQRKNELKQAIIKHPILNYLAITQWGGSAKEVVRNVSKAIRLLRNHELSRHQIASQIFENPKHLKEAQLQNLVDYYPSIKNNFRKRKVILSCSCFQEPKQCLIVENMDSYHYLLPFIPSDWMLVCGFGARVTKQRILDPNITDFHFHEGVSGAVIEACKGLWVTASAPKYYWGDIDKKGLEIFEGLRVQIPNLELWQPGYQSLLNTQESITIERLKEVLSEFSIYQESAIITPSDFKN